MEPEPQVQAAPLRREHAGGVIGVGVGLFAILVLVLAILGQRGESTDPRAIFDEVFACAEPPLGFELTGGVRLPGGDRVARLELTDPAQWESQEPAPRSLFLAVHRRSGTVTRQFASLGRGQPEKLGQWQENPTFAFDLVLDRDELEWSSWRATYVHQREFKQGGTWSDGVRVNLTRGEHYAVLHARWPDEVEADPESLLPLLSALELRE